LKQSTYGLIVWLMEFCTIIKVGVQQIKSVNNSLWCFLEFVLCCWSVCVSMWKWKLVTWCCSVFTCQ